MVAKKKICPSCGRKKFLWNRKVGCIDCVNKVSVKKRMSDPSTVKPSKGLRPYLIAKKEYIEELTNNKCEAKGFSEYCAGIGNEIHHFFQYRIGAALSDKNQFRYVCRNCHTKIHKEVKEAVEAGHLASKEEKAKYIKRISRF